MKRSRTFFFPPLSSVGWIFFWCFFSLFFSGVLLFAESAPCVNPESPMRLPAVFDGKLIPREFGCWFPRAWEAEEPEGFKPFLDAIGNRAAFDMLAVSSRLTQSESISPEAIAFHENAARYAWEKYGVRLLPDSEIRLSRKAFHAEFPEKSLWRIRFAEAEQGAGESIALVLSDSAIGDHYSHNYRYEVLSVKGVKVWSFAKTESGLVDPASVRDATSEAKWITEAEKPGWIQLVLDGTEVQEARFICAAARFEYLYPDVYAQEALDFERRLFEAHANVPAGGLVKDEWGFLPCHETVPMKDHFWYSDSMAEAYAEKTGRVLTDDLFLMHLAQDGAEAVERRTQAIDDFNRMNFARLLKFEEQVYRISRDLFGKDAMVATHPTWHAYPNVQEFRKNSLFWWRHPRDFAQTDEYVPFACRTGMSKREGNVWFNEFYANDVEPYLYEEWTCAAAGGRQNIHPFCCSSENPRRTKENFGALPILDSGVEAVRVKTRLLSFKTNAPLFSPVAVVFGHWGCQNWNRPEFGNLTEALNICDFFATRGIPADLIPSSEAREKTLANAPCWRLNERGFLQYGAQEYRLLVFYAETSSDEQDFAFLRELNQTGKTRIVSAPGRVSPEGIEEILAPCLEDSELLDVGRQTPWKLEAHLNGDRNRHTHPGMEAFSRRLDGTFVWTRASAASPTGEPILLENESVASNDLAKTFLITARANGLLACRFGEDGELEALTAAGLTLFRCDGATPFPIVLEKPADIVLWKDENGRWQGIFQDVKNVVPDALADMPVVWRFLQKPIDPPTGRQIEFFGTPIENPE